MQADGMAEMHEGCIGKQQLCRLLDDLIDVRCDGKLRLINRSEFLSPILLPHPFVLLQMNLSREDFYLPPRSARTR